MPQIVLESTTARIAVATSVCYHCRLYIAEVNPDSNVRGAGLLGGSRVNYIRDTRSLAFAARKRAQAALRRKRKRRILEPCLTAVDEDVSSDPERSDSATDSDGKSEALPGKTQLFVPKYHPHNERKAAKQRLKRNQVVDEIVANRQLDALDPADIEKGTVVPHFRVETIARNTHSVLNGKAHSHAKKLRGILKKFRRHATPELVRMDPREMLNTAHAVYMVIYLPTCSLYVGQTTHTLFDRLRRHVYARYADKVTGLSAQIALDSTPTNYAMVALHKFNEDTTLDARHDVEEQYITLFKADLNSRRRHQEQRTGQKGTKPPQRLRNDPTPSDVDTADASSGDGLPSVETNDDPVTHKPKGLTHKEQRTLLWLGKQLYRAGDVSGRRITPDLRKFHSALENMRLKTLRNLLSATRVIFPEKQSTKKKKKSNVKSPCSQVASIAKSHSQTQDTWTSTVPSFGTPEETVETCRKLQPFLKEAIKAHDINAKSDKDPIWFKIGFNNVAMDKCGRVALNSVQWPFHTKKQSVRICHVTRPTLGSMTMNQSHFSRGTDEDIDCHCEEWSRHAGQKQLWPTKDGTKHVHIPAFEFCRSVPKLRPLAPFFEKGCKFRFPMGIKKTLKYFDAQADAFVDYMLERERKQGKTHVDPTKFLSELKLAFRKEVKLNVQRKQRKHISMPENMQELIEVLQKNFVIVPADRNFQQTMLWCRHLYNEVCTDHFDSEAFQDVTDDEVRAIDKKAKQLSEKFLLEECDAKNRPYLYVISKSYKPVKIVDEKIIYPMRPIVGTAKRRDEDGSGSSTSEISSSPSTSSKARRQVRKKTPPTNYMTPHGRKLSQLGRAVIDFAMWRNEELQEDAKPFLAINSVTHFMANMHRLKEDGHSIAMTQSDMGAMYTSLRQEDVVRNCRAMFEEIFTSAGSIIGCDVDEVTLRLIVPPNSHKLRSSMWRRGGTGFNLKQVFELLDFCVTSAIVEYRGVLKRQAAGIGMGINSSPELSTLCCAWTERQHFHAPTDAVRYFASRYIDDALGDSRLTWPTAEEYGIQEIKVTNNITSTVHLGISITTAPKVTFAPADKNADKVKFPNGVFRFPYKHSCISEDSIIGVIIGQLVYAFQMSSSISLGLEAATRSLQELKGKGYSNEDIERGTDRFLRRHFDATFVNRISLKKLLLEDIVVRGNARFVPLLGQGNKPIVCFRCGGKGHTRRTCPQDQPQRSDRGHKHDICKNCRSPDHTLWDCKAGGLVCWHCGDLHHKAHNCPKNRRPSGPQQTGDRFFDLCQQKDPRRHKKHSSRGHGQGHSTQAKCWNCHEPGHYLSSCPAGGIVCWNCKEVGHKSQNCRRDIKAPPQRADPADAPVTSVHVVPDKANLPKPLTQQPQQHHKDQPIRIPTLGTSCAISAAVALLETMVLEGRNAAMITKLKTINVLGLLFRRQSYANTKRALKEVQRRIDHNPGMSQDAMVTVTRLRQVFPSPAWEAATFKVKTVTSCKECGKATVNFQPMHFWTIPLDFNEVDLVSTHTEYRSKPCRDCGCTYFSTTKTRTTTPDALIVRIERSISYKKKSHRLVSTNSMSTTKLGTFDLAGVVRHEGQFSNNGHYFPVVRRGSKWWKCMDETFEETAAPMSSKEDYILLYLRDRSKNVEANDVPAAQPQPSRASPIINLSPTEAVPLPDVSPSTFPPPKQESALSKGIPNLDRINCHLIVHVHTMRTAILCVPRIADALRKSMTGDILLQILALIDPEAHRGEAEESKLSSLMEELKLLIGVGIESNLHQDSNESWEKLLDAVLRTEDTAALRTLRMAFMKEVRVCFHCNACNKDVRETEYSAGATFAAESGVDPVVKLQSSLAPISAKYCRLCTSCLAEPRNKLAMLGKVPTTRVDVTTEVTRMPQLIHVNVNRNTREAGDRANLARVELPETFPLTIDAQGLYTSKYDTSMKSTSLFKAYVIVEWGHGTTVQSGHYVAATREADDSWGKYNDDAMPQRLVSFRAAFDPRHFVKVVYKQGDTYMKDAPAARPTSAPVAPRGGQSQAVPSYGSGLFKAPTQAPKKRARSSTNDSDHVEKYGKPEDETELLTHDDILRMLSTSAKVGDEIELTWRSVDNNGQWETHTGRIERLPTESRQYVVKYKGWKNPEELPMISDPDIRYKHLVIIPGGVQKTRSPPGSQPPPSPRKVQPQKYKAPTSVSPSPRLSSRTLELTPLPPQGTLEPASPPPPASTKVNTPPPTAKVSSTAKASPVPLPANTPASPATPRALIHCLSLGEVCRLENGDAEMIAKFSAHVSCMLRRSDTPTDRSDQTVRSLLARGANEAVRVASSDRLFHEFVYGECSKTSSVKATPKRDRESRNAELQLAARRAEVPPDGERASSGSVDEQQEKRRHAE